MTKTKLLLISFVLLLTASLFMASEDGRDDDRSGAPPSFASCNECHGSGGGGGNVQISGQPNGPYANGQVYTITLTAFDVNAIVGGFQIVSRNAANQNLGFWTPGTGSRLSGNGGLTHSSPRNYDVDDMVSWSFTWTAPASGNVPVLFYFASVAANGNGMNGNGDDVYLNSVLGCQIPVTISGPSNVCNGSSVTLTASGADTYVWQPGNLTGASITVSPTNTTTYSVLGTSMASGCTGSDTHQVIVRPKPNATISTTHVTCNGLNNGAATATGSGGQGPYTYDWSNGSSGATINNLAPGPYIVTVTDNFGCTKTNSTTITQPTPLVAAFTGGTVACPAQVVTLNVTASGGTAPYTGTGPVDLSAGTYSLVVVDNHNCTDDVSVTITENPAPDPVITGNLTFCQGLSTVLNAGPGYSGYQWSNGAFTQTTTISNAGTVSVTVTDANGCTGTASVTINTVPAPTATITGPSTLCPGNSITLTATAGMQAYHWSTNAATQSINVSTAGTYSVTVTNNGNCSATTSKVVVADNAPDVIISGSTSFCLGSSTILDAGAGFTSYAWNGPNGFNATTQTINVNVAGLYTVVVTSAGNCSGTDNVTVTQNTNLQVTINGPAGLCPNTSASLQATTGFTNYLWSNNATTSAIDVLQGGTYSVTVNNGSGCSGADTITVVNFPAATVQIEGDSIICGADTTHLFATGNGVLFNWSTGETTQSIVASQEGPHGVTVTDANGCTASDEIEIVVIPVLVVTLPGPSSFCTGGSIIIDAGAGFALYLWSTGEQTQTIIVTEPATYTVTLTPVEGCNGYGTKTITQSDSLEPIIFGYPAFCEGFSTQLSVGSGYATYAWSNGTQTDTTIVNVPGQISVTVTDASGCSGSVQGDVIEYPAPDLTIIPEVLIPCFTDSTQVQFDGWSQVDWSNGASGPIQWVKRGNYSVTVTDVNGCTATAAFGVFSPDSLALAASIDDNDVVLDASGGVQPYTYQWPDLSNLKVRNDLPNGSYTVKVFDANNCQATLTFTVNSTGTSQTLSNQLQLTPNPAYDQVLLRGIEFNVGDRIKIMNSSGQELANYTINQATDQFEFSAKSFSPGMYILHVRMMQNVANKVFIKN